MLEGNDTMTTKPTAIPGNYTIVKGFRSGYLGRIAQLHGEYYEKAWGSGPGFEAVMARELCDFCEQYDARRDLLLTAHIDGKLVGCIAIVGTQDERPGEARLRWFLLEEGYQGAGHRPRVAESSAGLLPGAEISHRLPLDCHRSSRIMASV